MPFFSNQKLVIKKQLAKIVSLLSRNKGFTLIELLIVLVIIGILSGISLASFRGPTNRQEIKASALALKTELRRYQNYAISGQKLPNPESDLCTVPANDPPPMLFYNVSITSASDYVAELFCGDVVLPTIDEITVDPPWSEGIGILGFETTAGFPCAGNVDIHFLPLNRGTELFCGGNSVTDVTFRIGNLLDPSFIYRVTINKDGVINAQPE